MANPTAGQKSAFIAKITPLLVNENKEVAKRIEASTKNGSTPNRSVHFGVMTNFIDAKGVKVAQAIIDKFGEDVWKEIINAVLNEFWPMETTFELGDI